VDKLAAHLPVLKGQSWTLRAALPGGDFPINGAANLATTLERDFRFLPPSLVHRWVRSYGTRTRTMLSSAKLLSDLGTDFGHDLYAAEVDYLIDHEWAKSADDILWRRSKLGLRFSVAATQKLEKYVKVKLQRRHT
jgi:glycerol-3-phosphate dehydrogenase